MFPKCRGQQQIQQWVLQRRWMRMQIRQLPVRIRTAIIRRIVRIILADMIAVTQMGTIHQTARTGTETAVIQMGTTHRTARIIAQEQADMLAAIQMGIIRRTAHTGTETAVIQMGTTHQTARTGTDIAVTQMGTIRRTARTGAGASGILAAEAAQVIADIMGEDIMEEVTIDGD